MNAKNRTLTGRILGSAALVGALSVCLPANAQNETSTTDEVQVTDYGTVTLAVQDTDLAKVLEMLSIQSQKNIITSKNVSATISANLYDVTFYEALDSILKVNGYDYVEDGNFIYIYTQTEMEELRNASRMTESRIFKLDNIAAADANELILPLLSDSGKSSFRGDVEPGIQPDSSDAGGENWAFSAMLVVNDYPENLESIASLLSGLDELPSQVLVEATILQTTLDESNAFGIDFSVIGSVNFSDFTNPLSGVANLLLGGTDAGFQPSDNTATVASSTVGNTARAGGFKVGVLRDDIAVFLRLLDEVTDSTVLARPKVMCLNRQRAEVLVGARVGYLSTTATETTTTQTVEFLDTGIQLQFRPFISTNDMVRLELAPSVSEASLRQVTDAQGLSVTIPDELTNEVTTNVRVKDGSTIVLGGLFREATSITRRQTPLLGDLPIVGAAFRGQDDVVDRTEIIFLITPNVMHDEEAFALGDAALGFTEDAMVGSRQGLLGFGRSKMTDNENNRALTAYRSGDLDAALYHSNNSLRLNPGQPEIVRLRSLILGERVRPHERSILEHVIHRGYGAAGTAKSNDYELPAWITAEPSDDPKPFSNENETADASTNQPWSKELDGNTADANVTSSDDFDQAISALEADVPVAASTTEETLPFEESDVNDAIENAAVSAQDDENWTTPSPSGFDQNENMTPNDDAFVPFDEDTEVADAETDDLAAVTETPVFEQRPVEYKRMASKSTPSATPVESTETFSAFEEATASISRNTDEALSALEAAKSTNDYTASVTPEQETSWSPSASSTSSVASNDVGSLDLFTQQFIHQYFTATGLESLSPYNPPAIDTTASASTPSSTPVTSPFLTSPAPNTNVQAPAWNANATASAPMEGFKPFLPMPIQRTPATPTVPFKVGNEEFLPFAEVTEVAEVSTDDELN